MSNKVLFGLLAGIPYIIFGLIQTTVSFGFRSDWTGLLSVPNDFIGGFVLILIGTIFLAGVKELRAGTVEGVAYIYVGIFIALLFALIYLLVVTANALEAYVIMNDDFKGWSPLDDFRPGIYLAIIPLIGYLIWREKFSLISRAGV